MYYPSTVVGYNICILKHDMRFAFKDIRGHIVDISISSPPANQEPPKYPTIAAHRHIYFYLLLVSDNWIVVQEHLRIIMTIHIMIRYLK